MSSALLKSRMAGIPLLAACVLLLFTSSATAASAVLLGTADPFAVLGGSTITNTGNTVINGELGLHPGTAVTGFPPGIVNGAQHITDAVALQAKTDLVTAYQDAAGRPLTATASADLGGQSLTGGVYRTGGVPSIGLTGNLTLDAQGDPRTVWIFQIGSTLTTATDSSVTLINGAQACNVFWQVGSSATLGTRTVFAGNILALTSISVNDGVVVNGRLLARNGAVTLINDTVTRAVCAAGTEPVGVTPTPDTTGPRTEISDVPNHNPNPNGADCVNTRFTVRLRSRDIAGIRSVHVYLDGRLIKRTIQPRSSIVIRVRGLRVGTHRVSVVAVDRAGNRSVTRQRFARCVLGVAAPNFTG